METPSTDNAPFAITFGTYRLAGPSAAARVRAALALGVRRVDTAPLYRNEAEVFAAVRDFEAAHPTERVHVTTKVFDELRFEPAVEAIAASARSLGRPLDRVLLHRPLPPIMWRAVNACVEEGHTREIGVSNHTVEQLEALLEMGLRPPVVDQVELHPFVGPVQPLLAFCAARSIRVQAHTLLTRGERLGFAPLVALAAAYDASPAALLVRWAHQLGVEPVVSSTRDDHLRELAEAVAKVGTITAHDMATINAFYAIDTRRFFPNRAAPPSIAALDDVTDTGAYVQTVANLLANDAQSVQTGRAVSDTAHRLPFRSHRQLMTDPLAQQIARLLFPDDAAASRQDRFRALVRKLRALAPPVTTPKPSRCAVPVDHPSRRSVPCVEGAPVSAAVAFPAAMPVEVSPARELAPFFAFLASPSPRSALPVTFARGTYFPDQRMDLCKQVVGPDHVGALCAAVASQARHRPGSKRVRHFLLGNNVACAGDSTAGAEALARLMADPASEIETWYLAGNAIGPADLAVIAEALASSRHAKALWLKRNPIGPDGAPALGRLLARSASLRLLDVHNTGLFDEGVEAMARAFERDGGPLRLRHLYLSANALGPAAVDALGRMLRPSPSSIASLYLSMNRLGERGLEALVGLIRQGALAGLKRLDVGSIGLSRPDLDPLVDALLGACPALVHLDLGTYKSTRDMGERANRLDPDVTPLVRLLSRHPSLRLLNAANAGLPEASVARLVAALGPDQSLEGVGAHALRHGHTTRRLLRQPKRVLHIDSVYRGRA